MSIKERLENAAKEAGFPKPESVADALMDAHNALVQKLPEGCVAIVGVAHPDARGHLAYVQMTECENRHALNESIGKALAVAVGRSDSDDKETRVVGFQLGVRT